MVGWDTASDWDSAQSTNGVRSEQPANTDFAASDALEKGYPTTDQNGSALAAYYPLHEDSGSTLYEVSGNGHDLTEGGSPTYGNAGGILDTTYLTFDGTDDVKYATTGTTFDYGVGFTLSIWLNSSTFNDYAGLFVTRTTGGARAQIQARSSGVVRANLSDGSSSVDVPGPTYDDGTWHNVTVVYDPNASNQARIYGDGSLADSKTQSLSGTFTNPLQIGAEKDPGPYFDGALAEARAWTRPLTDSQVSDIYETVL